MTGSPHPAPQSPAPQPSVPQAPPPASRPGRARWAVGVPLVVVGAALLLYALSLGRDDATASPEPSAPTETSATGTATDDATDGATGTQEMPDMARRDPADPLAMGEVDAPVVLTVYSDYQCPYCGKWTVDTLPLVVSDYVADGRVRIEWRDVNVFGPDSRRAAQAAFAAGLQGAFWEYHAELFPGGATRDAAGLTEDALVALAVELGLDGERLRADMTSEAVAAEVQRNEDEGIYLGAFSTPSFLVGRTPMVGAQPTATFVTAIEAELERAGA